MSSKLSLASEPRVVHQTEFSAGKGNALQACVASLFSVSLLSEVPNFIEDERGYEIGLIEFAKLQGLTFTKIPLSASSSSSSSNNDEEMVKRCDRFCILRGVSPRGAHGHVVVAKVVAAAGNTGNDDDGAKKKAYDFKMICDPHPDATFLDKSQPYGWAAFFE